MIHGVTKYLILKIVSCIQVNLFRSVSSKDYELIVRNAVHLYKLLRREKTGEYDKNTIKIGIKLNV